MSRLVNTFQQLAAAGKCATLVALAAVSAVSAFAQVTITGYFGGSYDAFSVGSTNAARTGATSENRISDQSSRIIFGVTEDLGSGLSAIGQFDLRFKLDATARIQSETTTNPTVDPVSSGNQHVGLKKAGVGTLRLGRQDIYYGEAANYLPAGLFLAANPQPLFHSLATANASRTPNLIWFTSDRMNGVEATVGYSTQPLRTSGTNEVESNMGTTTNTGHGGGTYIKLNYANGPLDLTYALVDLKSGYAGGTAYSVTTGAGGAASNAEKDQYGQTLVAKYDFMNGFKGALGYSKEKQTSVVTGAAVTTATAIAGLAPALVVGSSTTAAAWTASGIYTMGPNSFVVNFAKRGNTSYDGVEQAATGGNQTTLAYSYDLSKQTTVGLMYSALKSQSNVGYGMFYQGNNAYGGQMLNMLGETQKMTSIALRKNF